MAKIYDFYEYRMSVFSDTTIKIKRKFLKWQISTEKTAQNVSHKI